jgi:Flp pilus assembly protein TadB
VSRLVVVLAIALWTGTALVFAELRWFARPGLTARLRTYGPASGAHAGPISFASFREVVSPLANAMGDRLARVAGVSEALALRLERVHSSLDVAGFRLRQVGWSALAFGLGALVTLATRPGPVVGVAVILGTPLVAFLVVEERLARASRDWQDRLFYELPVVAEQLAMLISAGFSLTASLDRIATRGGGACAADLSRVGVRIGQGLGEDRALLEWGTIANVDAVDRLISVLALNRETSDLGRLLAEEARSIRREAQRRLTETLERRSQQVWIPVTVAALVPGVILLAVPFIQVMRIFTGP